MLLCGDKGGESLGRGVGGEKKRVINRILYVLIKSSYIALPKNQRSRVFGVEEFLVEATSGVEGWSSGTEDTAGRN